MDVLLWNDEQASVLESIQEAGNLNQAAQLESPDEENKATTVARRSSINAQNFKRHFKSRFCCLREAG